jgi:hypothetical protein
MRFGAGLQEHAHEDEGMPPSLLEYVFVVPSAAEGRAVVLGCVDVLEREQFGVDGPEVVVPDDARSHGLAKIRDPEPPSREQRMNGRADGRASVERRERLNVASRFEEDDVVVTDQVSKPGDPGGSQKRNVRSRDVGEGYGVSQRLQASREPLQGAAAFQSVADNADALREGGQLLQRGGDDDDRSRRNAREAYDSLEHQLRPERQPGFGSAHATTTATAEDDRSESVHLKPLCFLDFASLPANFEPLL